MNIFHSDRIKSLLVFFGVILFGGGIFQIAQPLIGTDISLYVLYKQLRDEPRDDIVIVALDTKTLDSLSRTDLKMLTFSKEIFTKTIQKLRQDGVRAIGIDVVFANPDPAIGALVRELESYKNIVVAAKVGGSSGELQEQILPLSEIPKKYWGMIDMKFEKNLLTRTIPLASLGDQKIEHFTIALSRKIFGERDGEIGSVSGGRYNINELQSIPLDTEGNMYIPFFRKSREYPKYSLIDVLHGNIAPGTFTNKIVLIGESGTLIHDSHFSPTNFGIDTPGVEFHANLLEGILQSKYLIPWNSMQQWLVLVCIAFTMMGIVSLLPALWSLPFLFVAAIGILLAGWIGMMQGVRIDIFAWWYFVCVLPAIAGGLYRYLLVNRNKRLLTSAFSRYISPELVQEISKHPESIGLGGKNEHICIFFSDIAGFTSISEKLSASQLFELIGEYLAECTNILTQEQGTLDKYIGDAIMGFFGAPVRLANPSRSACICALKIQKRLIELEEKWIARGIAKIETRIGLHTGEAMVGNIGSLQRFNYTALGDAVNTASRLENINKLYGTSICISEAVKQEAGDGLYHRKLDVLRVKGKNEPITLYELLSLEQWENNKDLYGTYERALNKYIHGDYLEAEKIFSTITHDSAALALLHRCQKIIEGNLYLDGGVYTMEQK